MSWRPKEGWENPYHKSGNFGSGLEHWNEEPEFSCFEAGADAMLEALWKMARESPTKTFTLDANEIHCFGIFIPEES